MTTTAPMLPRPATLTRAVLLFALLVPVWFTGCLSPVRRLNAPQVLTAPYPVQGERVWAVVPLRNESGTTAANAMRISDTLVAHLTQVDGIAAVPLNRTIGAMQALGFNSIDSAAQALALARMIGADAIVLGSITAYEPYEPLRLGLTLGVFSVAPEIIGAGAEPAPTDDQIAFRKASTDRTLDGSSDIAQPLSAVAAVFDADNHAILMDLRRFTTGRHDETAALGWEAYTRSMGRYSEFVCFRTIELLLGAEARRLAAAGTPPPPADSEGSNLTSAR